MDKVLVKALNLACGLHIYEENGFPSRPATVDEIVSAAGRFAAFLRNGYIENQPGALPPARLIPVVPIEESVHDDYIVCLNDGVKCKMMKRHLDVVGYTPETYRAFWGLPPDYPMTAPNYAKTRSELAKKAGLGTQGTTPRHRRAGA